MTGNGLFQIVFFLAVLITLAVPLGIFMARVYDDKQYAFNILCPIENFIYRFSGIDKNSEMTWKSYVVAVLLFNFVGFLFAYFLQRWQFLLPLNPALLHAVKPDLAFNTAVSYVTNTNWQAYAGETTLSYISQALALTVQNFVSAATGMAVAIALIRGIVRREADKIGNFWVDLVRGTLYILIPLSVILALLLVSQGVIQNFHPYQKVSYLMHQILPMGPAASQIAIKQLGSNGGGFFGTNSAFPFENPTPFSNFLEMLAIVLIPAAFCFTFGKMVGDKKQGIAIFLVMTIIFVCFLFFAVHAEQGGNRLFNALNIDQSVHTGLWSSPGGNLEGKEMRFGVVNSALWTTVSTAVANGSVNSMLDSYTPLGGMVPIYLMQLGEIVYGGDGSGLYGMLLFVILTVFIAGLMVGRSPEYLGKKIEVFEMKMAALAVLVPHFLILPLTAIAVTSTLGLSSLGNPGMHGFSEILYAFTSSANNNGSAFMGLNTNTVFYNLTTGLAMFIGRFWLIVPVLAIAGSLARKKTIPVTQGTMPTHTMLFVFLVISVIMIIGALTFFPALALGPVVEHLVLINNL